MGLHEMLMYCSDRASVVGVELLRKRPKKQVPTYNATWL